MFPVYLPAYHPDYNCVDSYVEPQGEPGKHRKTHCCVDRWVHNSSVLGLGCIHLKPQVFVIPNTSTFAGWAQTYTCTAVLYGSLTTHWTFSALNVPTEHPEVKRIITPQMHANFCFNTHDARTGDTQGGGCVLELFNATHQTWQRMWSSTQSQSLFNANSDPARDARTSLEQTECFVNPGCTDETNRRKTRVGLCVGREVRNICELMCVSCSGKQRKVSSPTAHDLIAILQHELCKEIGQLACFLSYRANQTQMKPCWNNNHVFVGSSSGDKQRLGINIKPPTCLEAKTIKGKSQGMSYWFDAIDMSEL